MLKTMAYTYICSMWSTYY